MPDIHVSAQLVSALPPVAVAQGLPIDPSAPQGTPDAFAALLAGKLAPTGPVPQATRLAALQMQAVAGGKPTVTKCHRRRRAGTAPIKKPKAPGQHAGCTVALKPFQSGALRREHSALRFDAGDNPIVAALGQLKANAVTLVKSGDIQTGVYRR